MHIHAIWDDGRIGLWSIFRFDQTSCASFSSLLHQSLSLDSQTEEIINIKMKGMASPYEGAREAVLSDGRIISVKLKCCCCFFLNPSLRWTIWRAAEISLMQSEKLNEKMIKLSSFDSLCAALSEDHTLCQHRIPARVHRVSLLYRWEHQSSSNKALTMLQQRISISFNSHREIAHGMEFYYLTYFLIRVLWHICVPHNHKNSSNLLTFNLEQLRPPDPHFRFLNVQQ